MSDRKERSWVLQQLMLLLLICLGLIPAEVIANSIPIPNPCQSGQTYINGACGQVIINVFNAGCGGQTGIPCQPGTSFVVPGTPVCPNAPLSPIVVPSVPIVVPGTPACPNAPLDPTVVPSVPIVVPGSPVVVPGTPACPNAPLDPTVVPSPPVIVPGTPTCPNAPLDPTVVPSPPVVVPGTPACPNAPLDPTVVPTAPVQPTVCPPSCPTTCSNNCNQSTQCPNSCPTNCPNSPCPTPPPTITPSPPTLYPTPMPYPPPAPPAPQTTQQPYPVPVTTPPPATITRCREGTILVRGVCRLLFCGGYGINAEGRCIQARCPAGYVWTGIRCSKPQPVEIGNIHIESNVHQQAGALPHLVTNNVNNVKVNASIAIQGQTSAEQQEEEEEEEEEPVMPQPPSGPCCNVVAPRICTIQADQVAYKCFSRSQQQCGSFCSANKVVLAPPTVTTWTQANTQMMVLPPNWAGQGCQSTGGNCQQAQNYYDCSGCAMGDFSTCSSYCYSYKCSSHNCVYYDQTQYCSQYPGQMGCRSEDGWFPAP
ncbi:keratin-associated protein 16-1 isoform X2 [Drosophila elegans]|uniref:keratin-associated protein 16-1 isoform X2 n=1 Tax=Drosophila elegans TaxID=30023 RepID=UPI0007E6433A|nr:keratin-associated protein 16-1 isoform X2 [Drosophila elegans]